MSTLNKVKEGLEALDEIQVLELLDIKSSELVERFEDKIKLRVGYIAKELEYVSEEDESHREELNFEDDDGPSENKWD